MSVSDSSNTVVQLSSTVWIIEDTTLVAHDSVGSDGNGGWSSGNKVFQRLAVVLWNIVVSSDVTGWGLSRSLTTSISGGIRIVGFLNDSVVLDVSESVVHKTTATSVVSVGSGTVDQLLLGEAEEGSLVDLPLSFQSSDGGESPTGTALSLVLNCVDGTLIDPVDGWWVGSWGALDEILWSGGESESGELGHELLLGHVRELIESSFVAHVVLGVVGLDLQVVHVEDSESEKLLLWSVVGFSVVSGPLDEQLDDLGWAVGLGLGGELVGSGTEHGGGCDDGEDLIQLHFFYIKMVL